MGRRPWNLLAIDEDNVPEGDGRPDREIQRKSLSSLLEFLVEGRVLDAGDMPDSGPIQRPLLEEAAEGGQRRVRQRVRVHPVLGTLTLDPVPRIFGQVRDQLLRVESFGVSHRNALLYSFNDLLSYTSKFLTYLALFSINFRRGSTSSPMSRLKIASASAALSTVTW